MFGVACYVPTVSLTTQHRFIKNGITVVKSSLEILWKNMIGEGLKNVRICLPKEGILLKRKEMTRTF